MSDVPKKQAKRYYHKNQFLFALIAKMKLWPSRKGVLHGIRSLEINGELAVITTHCGESCVARNSKTSRASRWLRNKFFVKACPRCAIPDWKLDKYQGTEFRKKFGAKLPEQPQHTEGRSGT